MGPEAKRGRGGSRRVDAQPEGCPLIVDDRAPGSSQNDQQQMSEAAPKGCVWVRDFGQNCRSMRCHYAVLFEAQQRDEMSLISNLFENLTNFRPWSEA
jgi:hypothetical protein